MGFRKDINGLRAIAVLAVMLYHFGIPGFSGGFVGVDVFFVISGYLMTGLLLKAQNSSQISLATFYAARCRRILPALLFVCLVLVVMGWLFLPPSDLNTLGMQITTALSFTSNVLFYGESGYFSPLSQEKWLLHTWSLSVEWQFYLLFPLFIMLLHRVRHTISMGQGLALLAAISLLICVVVTSRSPDFAFFQLPARMWELVAGGLIYIYADRFALSLRQARILQVTGALLLAACIYFMDSSMPWPGIYALLPVLAVSLILYARIENARFLSLGVMQSLGNWSYSIYLWHWPAVVALAYLHLSKNPVWLLAGITFSIGMGAISYRYIEMPAKHLTIGHYRLLVPTVLMFSIASMLVIGHGYPQRVSAQVQMADREIGNIFMPESVCQRQKPQPALWQCGEGAPRFAMWGDSHALSVFPAVQKAAGNAAGLLYSQSCPPLENAYLDDKRSHRHCQANTAAILADLANMPADMPLIFAFRYSYYLHGYNEDPGRAVNLRFLNLAPESEQAGKSAVFAARLEETLCRAASGRQRIYVVAPIPEIGVDVPKTFARRLMLSAEAKEPVLELQAYNTRHDVVLKALHRAAEHCGFTVLDPLAYLCADGVCKTVKDGRPLYADDDHLSASSDEYMAPLFAPAFSY